MKSKILNSFRTDFFLLCLGSCENFTLILFHQQNGKSQGSRGIEGQWFSIRGNLAPRVHLAMFGDTFGCHNKVGSATGIYWVETCNIAMLGITPTKKKNNLAQMSTVLRLRYSVVSYGEKNDPSQNPTKCLEQDTYADCYAFALLRRHNNLSHALEMLKRWILLHWAIDAHRLTHFGDGGSLVLMRKDDRQCIFIPQITWDAEQQFMIYKHKP